MVSIIVSNMASITMICIGCGSDISDAKGKWLLSTDECIAEIFPIAHWKYGKNIFSHGEIRDNGFLFWFQGTVNLTSLPHTHKENQLEEP